MRVLTVAAIVLGLAASTARADWDLDSANPDWKMHFPQMPDPLGWDVRISNARNPLEWVVADDWTCTESGLVRDVHFWVSWDQDFMDQIENIHLSIHDNIPAVAGGPDYSMPGNELWAMDFDPSQFSIRDWDSGQQGWYDAYFGDCFPDNHVLIQQINIVDIPNAFRQDANTIYWLDISVDLFGEGECGKMGWKTSLDYWEDIAVYRDVTGQWQPLYDPETGDRLDMAFVITPEPATMSLLGLGLAALAARRRRRRQA